MDTEDELKKFIADRTNAVWEQTNAPYFLSMIAPELRAQNVEYKKLVAGRTLKQIVSGMKDDLRVVVHPTQSAKIGLVPPNVPYEFESAPQPVAHNQSVHKESRPVRRKVKSKYALLQFFEALSLLDPSELEGVQIPVPVIVRLMRDQ